LRPASYYAPLANHNHLEGEKKLGKGEGGGLDLGTTEKRKRKEGKEVGGM